MHRSGVTPLLCKLGGMLRQQRYRIFYSFDIKCNPKRRQYSSHLSENLYKFSFYKSLKLFRDCIQSVLKSNSIALKIGSKHFSGPQRIFSRIQKLSLSLFVDGVCGLWVSESAGLIRAVGAGSESDRQMAPRSDPLSRGVVTGCFDFIGWSVSATEPLA